MANGELKNRPLGFICEETKSNIVLTVKDELATRGKVQKKTVARLREYAQEDASSHRALDYWGARMR